MFSKKDINDYAKEARDTSGAVLVDVRNRKEYEQGHLPGAVNIPLPDIQFSIGKLGPVSTPLFVYCLSGARSRQACNNLKNCLSGARSRQACNNLKKMGYEHVVNMGGISRWTGELEK